MSERKLDWTVHPDCASFVCQPPMKSSSDCFVGIGPPGTIKWDASTLLHPPAAIHTPPHRQTNELATKKHIKVQMYNTKRVAITPLLSLLTSHFIFAFCLCLRLPLLDVLWFPFVFTFVFFTILLQRAVCLGFPPVGFVSHGLSHLFFFSLHVDAAFLLWTFV